MNNTSKIINIRGLGIGLDTFNPEDLDECPNNYALLCNPGFSELTESKCDSSCEIISFRRAVNNRYDDRDCTSSNARLIIVDEYQDLITCVAKKLIRGIVSASYLCSAISKKKVVELVIPNKIISVGENCRYFSTDPSLLLNDIELVKRMSKIIEDESNESITHIEGFNPEVGVNLPAGSKAGYNSTSLIHMVRSISRDGKVLLLPIYKKVISVCSNIEDHATIRYIS